MNGSWNILSNKIISTSMVESHTISKAHTYTLGEHLLGKIFKMMLENGSDSKSVIYFDRKSPKSLWKYHFL